MRILGWLVTTAATIGLLALASRVQIPMAPVPVTLQTLAVTLAGALLGWRHGGLAVALWLALGAAGLPVLAGGGAGLAKFEGATAGYLFAFPVAAALVGALMARGWDRSWVLAIAAMLIGNSVCLAGGAAWLAWQGQSMARAWASGVEPFLIGAALKAAAGGLAMRWLAANGFRTPR
ncbi:biotin transport system substrate-specific component [Sphingomonas naasensis]|nr:biotin transporter BioY [Sphingomonas naasensis]NIJ21342.1 biotin transport system substrate-specific component [Sphingomonas naasensis]